MAQAPPLRRFLHIARRTYRKPLLQVAFFVLSVVLFSALLIYYVERPGAAANIGSLWDGIWWAIVTMGTVGYGDKFPVTTGGRWVGIFLIFTGVGLMSLFTATIASVFVERRMKEGMGLEKIKAKEHIIICGWNRHAEEVIEGLTTYGAQRDRTIVLINELPMEEVENLRVKYSKYELKFLRGDYVREEVLRRANLPQAHFVMILADQTGGRHPERTDERTALAALTVKSLAPQVKTVAELLDEENRPHLKRANVDEIIVRGEHVGALLAGAVNSPGLPRCVSQLLSLGDKNKLWRVAIPHGFVNRPFKELALHYREKEKAIRIDDILSDNTSAIDTFIREKLREAKRDFAVEKETLRVQLNPDDDYPVAADDLAIILARNIPNAG